MGNYTTIEGDAIVKPGRLSRSANPADASAEDSVVWLHDRKIGTWLDFRGREEGSKPDPMRDYYDTKLITKTGQLKDVSKASKVDELSPSVKRTRYVVDLDYTGTIKRFFKKHATIFEKLLMLIAHYFLSYFWKASVFWVIRKFYGRLGIQGLYLTFLEETKPQLCTALKLVANEPNGAHVNCMLGKDRTGTISALILLALGVPAERVCYDYALTGKYLSKEYVSSLLAAVNLDSEEFASSRQSAMNYVITFMVSKYGGTDEYLNHIGFNAEWRAKLKSNYLQALARL